VGIAVRLGAFEKGASAGWPWYILPAVVLIYLVIAANFG
jgi:hypothetical protein